MIRAVLFDLDGVLADTEEYSGKAADMALSEAGVEKTDEERVGAFGRRDVDIMSDIIEARGLDLDVHAIIARKDVLFRELAHGNLEPLPGALELLKELDERGFGLAVVSSSTAEKLDFVLKEAGLFDFFRVRVNAEHVERGKPAPDAFLKAAELLGIPAGDCLVFEDAEYGVQAAKEAGMRCVAVRNPNTYGQDLGAADDVVDSLADFSVDSLYEM